MRWQDLRRSGNVQDRRSLGSKGVVGGAGGMFAIALVVYLLGGDPTSYLMEGVSRTIQSSVHKKSELTDEQQNEQADFVSAVLGSTEDVWGRVFSEHGETYQQPKLVLFAGAVDSACGTAQSAMGPFYCPNDAQVYLDLDFFYELEHKLGAPGDFARAYVIAHEVGHHIQNLQGILPEVHAKQRSMSKSAGNALSVRVELQADCYAGIWAHGIAEFNTLEEGDIQEAFKAAEQIGDDRLQQEGQGYVIPDSFTHGSSAQRMSWFKRGYESGQVASCDTFSSKI